MAIKLIEKQQPNKAEKSFNQIIIETIFDIVNKSIKKAPYNRIINGIVKNKIDGIGGLYSVDCQDAGVLEAYAVSPLNSYDTNANVRVLISNNSIANPPMIIGTVDGAASSTPVVETSVIKSASLTSGILEITCRNGKTYTTFCAVPTNTSTNKAGSVNDSNHSHTITSATPNLSGKTAIIFQGCVIGIK